jgi:hypothetical protein
MYTKNMYIHVRTGAKGLGERLSPTDYPWTLTDSNRLCITTIHNPLSPLPPIYGNGMLGT